MNVPLVNIKNLLVPVISSSIASYRESFKLNLIAIAVIIAILFGLGGIEDGFDTTILIKFRVICAS